MSSFLVLYGTSEGQTETIATRIGTVLDDRGHEVTTANAKDHTADLTLDDFDAVIVGSSIHAGAHQKSIREFVTANRDVLSRKPTAFFQVSLSSADEDQAAGYVEEFIEATDWHPDRIGLFGGALRYSEYGFLKRMMMKQIVKRQEIELPPADEAGDIELTDWDEVEAFAADVAGFVEQRLGIVPPAAGERVTFE